MIRGASIRTSNGNIERAVQHIYPLELSCDETRAAASIYSWGGGGGCRPKISEYFMAYEATKVFAIRKMKMQFTNKNTHSLRKDILQKHAVP